MKRFLEELEVGCERFTGLFQERGIKLDQTDGPARGLESFSHAFQNAELVSFDIDFEDERSAGPGGRTAGERGIDGEDGDLHDVIAVRFIGMQAGDGRGSAAPALVDEEIRAGLRAVGDESEVEVHSIAGGVLGQRLGDKRLQPGIGFEGVEFGAGGVIGGEEAFPEVESDIEGQPGASCAQACFQKI